MNILHRNQRYTKRGLALPLVLLMAFAVLLSSCNSSSDPAAPNADVAPTANFTATPNPTDPLMVVFTDTSTPGSAAITAWAWEFGDGGSSNLQNPTHTYAGAGTYNVSLTVTSSAGSNSRTNPTIATVTPVDPVANFTASSRSGNAPFAVQFTDTSIPGSAAINSWNWNFGDGESSTDQHPLHTYVGDGNFEVSLTVTTSVGSSTKTSPDYIEAYQDVIIDTIVEGPEIPALPVPANYGSPLPNESAPKYLASAWVREFRPIISQLRLTYWTGTNGREDCPDYVEGITRPADPGPYTNWYSGIPKRSGTDYYSWLPYSEGETWPGAFPTRITLYNTTYGAAGGVPRWSSCEEMTPLGYDWHTSYEISYNQPIAQVPVIRKARVWVKKVEENLGTGGMYDQTETYTEGVENTHAYEFSASISASVTAITPEMTATLSATLTETFSETITLTESTSISDHRTSPPHKDGYQLTFSIWQLVDRFTIEMPYEVGTLWQDANYQLNAPASQFVVDHPTGQVAAQAVWFRQ